MPRPKTETIQYMVLFSQRTVHEPSVLLSQKQDEAVCNPAPFFCIIVQVTEIKISYNINYRIFKQIQIKTNKNNTINITYTTLIL